MINVDLKFDLMTLVLEADLDIIQTYLYTESDVSKPVQQLQSRQTDRNRHTGKNTTFI